MTRLIISLFLISASLSKIHAENVVSLDRLLSAVERLVSFYQDNYHAMNLDGIFGLRELEGQVMLILEKISSEQRAGIRAATHIKDWNRSILRLSRLHKNARNISTLSLASLKSHSPSYYEKLHQLVEKPLKYAKPYKKIDPSLKWSSNQNPSMIDVTEELSEDFSDSCVAEILGSTSSSGVKCELSSDCLQFLLESKMKDYSLTHQILYTVIAEQNGCATKLTHYLLQHSVARSLEKLQAEFCTNNFYQVAELIRSAQGNIIPRMQDLFLEEQFVCPMLGYMEFLHNDWLDIILSWQLPSGCFGKMPVSSQGMAPREGQPDYEYMDNSQKLKKHDFIADKTPQQNQAMHKEWRTRAPQTTTAKDKIDSIVDIEIEHLVNTDNSARTRDGKMKRKTVFIPKANIEDSDVWRGAQRRLLLEKSLKDGCLAHKTAVAIAALAQYIRFMVHPGATDYHKEVSLEGINHLLAASYIEEFRQHNKSHSISTSTSAVPETSTYTQMVVSSSTAVKSVVTKEKEITEKHGSIENVAHGAGNQEQADQLLNHAGWSDNSPNQEIRGRQADPQLLPNVNDNLAWGEEDPPNSYYNAAEIELENKDGAVVMKELGHGSWEDTVQAVEGVASRGAGGVLGNVGGVLSKLGAMVEKSENGQPKESEVYDQYIDDENNEDSSEISEDKSPVDDIMQYKVFENVNRIDTGEDGSKEIFAGRDGDSAKPSSNPKDDDNYNYYDDKDDKVKPLDEVITLSAPESTSRSSGVHLSVHTMYAILLTAMILVLYIMWRFIKGRRVLIRYRYK